MSPFQLPSLVLGSCLQNDKCWFLCQNNLGLRLFLNICGGNFDELTRLTYANWFCSAWPDYAVIDRLIGLVMNSPSFHVTWHDARSLPCILLFLILKNVQEWLNSQLSFLIVVFTRFFRQGTYQCLFEVYVSTRYPWAFCAIFQSTFKRPSWSFLQPTHFRK